MEQIKTILQNNTCLLEDSKTGVQYLWANNKDDLEKCKKLKGINNIPEPTRCKFCGKTVYARGVKLFNIIHWFKPVCNCAESIKEQELERYKIEQERKQKEEEERRIAQKLRIERLFKNSKMGERFKNRTFENKITKQNLECDYTKTDKLLEEERRKAFKFLNKALEK